eukprot:31457-Pelagococcus_subviridis.AAC.4
MPDPPLRLPSRLLGRLPLAPSRYDTSRELLGVLLPLPSRFDASHTSFAAGDGSDPDLRRGVRLRPSPLAPTFASFRRLSPVFVNGIAPSCTSSFCALSSGVKSGGAREGRGGRARGVGCVSESLGGRDDATIRGGGVLGSKVAFAAGNELSTTGTTRTDVVLRVVRLRARDARDDGCDCGEEREERYREDDRRGFFALGHLLERGLHALPHRLRLRALVGVRNFRIIALALRRRRGGGRHVATRLPRGLVGYYVRDNLRGVERRVTLGARHPPRIRARGNASTRFACGSLYTDDDLFVIRSTHDDRRDRSHAIDPTRSIPLASRSRTGPETKNSRAFVPSRARTERARGRRRAPLSRRRARSAPRAGDSRHRARASPAPARTERLGGPRSFDPARGDDDGAAIRVRRAEEREEGFFARARARDAMGRSQYAEILDEAEAMERCARSHRSRASPRRRRRGRARRESPQRAPRRRHLNPPSLVPSASSRPSLRSVEVVVLNPPDPSPPLPRSPSRRVAAETKPPGRCGTSTRRPRGCR